MSDLDLARQTLANGKYTCVLAKVDKLMTSELRGVKPLVLWYRSGEDFSDFSAADKVVGKATAFLYLLLGVREIYADVVSSSAAKLLETQGVRLEYRELVPNIINRRGDGICPFESAVLDIDDTQDAYRAILAKMNELGIEY